MRGVPLDVPDLVRQRAMSNGVAGERWLQRLPEVVAALAERWSLEVGSSFSGGTASYVAAATNSSGRACVLKVAMLLDIDDADAFARSVLVHQLAGGHGCAELIDQDPLVSAMLLERLGPNLGELGMPLPRVLATIATTLRSLWRPIDDGAGLPTGADKATWLARSIVTCGRN